MLNNLTPTEFHINIRRLPNTVFRTQKVEIPSISTSAISVPTRFNEVFQTPDEMTYDTLNISFIVDENLENYREIYLWMKGLAFPENHKQYKDLKSSRDSLFSDISITLLTNHNNSNKEFVFFNCIPVSLSGIQLDITQSEITPVESSVSFRYDWFELK